MRKWFMAARPLVSPGELDALADRMIDGCANARNLRAAMMLAHRDRYALRFLRPRLFQFIAAVHGEALARSVLATARDVVQPYAERLQKALLPSDFTRFRRSDELTRCELVPCFADTRGTRDPQYRLQVA